MKSTANRYDPTAMAKSHTNKPSAKGIYEYNDDMFSMLDVCCSYIGMVNCSLM